MNVSYRKYDIAALAEKLFLWEHYEPWRILKSWTHRWWYHRQLFESGHIKAYLERTHRSMRHKLDDIHWWLKYRPVLFLNEGRAWVRTPNGQLTGYRHSEEPELFRHFELPICECFDINLRLYDSDWDEVADRDCWVYNRRYNEG